MTGSIPPQRWTRPPLATTYDGHGLGVLEESECLRLLSVERLGRLGMSIGSLPVILPVNYVLDGMTIVVRSEDGEKTRAAALGSVACLEIDFSDRFEHSGWSVLATGRLGIAPADRAERYEHLALTPWALTGSSRFIELPVELLSGRAITHTAH